MHAIMWSDYICPWCYLGRDRTALMRSLGMTVEQRPFELHPQIPDDGRENRVGGRLDQVLAMVGTECVELGMPYRRPPRSPRSRLALETAEVVRLHAPGAFDPFDDALFRTHWAEQGDIGDAAVVDRLLAEAGADVSEVHELVADGVGARVLADSMTEARSLGVTATPAWWVNDALLIPGAQPRETVERWCRKLLEREQATADRGADDAR